MSARDFLLSGGDLPGCLLSFVVTPLSGHLSDRDHGSAHQRAKLVLLTAGGKTAFAAAMKRQSAWATDLGGGLNAREIEAAAATLRSIRQRLDDRTDNGGDNAE